MMYFNLVFGKRTLPLKTTTCIKKIKVQSDVQHQLEIPKRTKNKLMIMRNIVIKVTKLIINKRLLMFDCLEPMKMQWN